MTTLSRIVFFCATFFIAYGSAKGVEMMVSLAGDYRIVQINGRPVVRGSAARTDFRLTPKGDAYGTAGCNQFTTHINIHGKQASFSPAASTKMFCPNQAVSAQEASFFAALQNVRGISRPTANTVDFLDQRGSVIIELQRRY